MSYIFNLLSKELTNVEHQLKKTHKALSNLSMQVNNTIAEIHQLETLRDELVNELNNHRANEDLPTRLEGSD